MVFSLGTASMLIASACVFFSAGAYFGFAVAVLGERRRKDRSNAGRAR